MTFKGNGCLERKKVLPANNYVSECLKIDFRIGTDLWNISAFEKTELMFIISIRD